MQKILCTLLLGLAGFQLAGTELVDSSKVNFILVEMHEGNKLLKTEDSFTDKLSGFDMSARLKTSRKVTRQEYLDFVGRQAEDWTESEKEKMNRILADIKELFKDYKINLPETIYLVKTSGLEEGNSAYCRGPNMIVASKKMLKQNYKNLLKLYVHELFHIYSKNNLDVREKLYNQIGFYKTKELVLPDSMRDHKITNPDSTDNNYYFDAVINGKHEKIMLLLFAASDYNERKGGEFFDYLQLVFIGVEEKADSCTLKTENGSICAYQLKDISNFFSKAGMNTDYILHAEEILADNFALMMTGAKNVKSPEIIANMKKVLRK